MAHNFDPRTQEAEAGWIFVNSRLVWSTKWAGQSGWQRETLPRREKKKEKTYYWKCPRAWVKIEVVPNQLCFCFSSQSFPLGRTFNLNNDSKAARQTAHYWTECQGSWEDNLTPHRSTALHSRGSFHSQGRLVQHFFSSHLLLGTAGIKGSLGEWKFHKHRTRIKYLGQKTRSPLDIQWTELTLLKKITIKK